MPCPGPGTRWAAKALVRSVYPCLRCGMYTDHAAHSMYTASCSDGLLASLSDRPFAVSCPRFFFFLCLPRFFAVVSNIGVFPILLAHLLSDAVAFNPLCGGRVALISTAGLAAGKSEQTYYILRVSASAISQ